MRNFLILSMVFLAGCATARSKFAEVGPGQSKDQITQLMGNPDEFYKDQGKDILVWKMDDYEKCAIMFGADNKVEGKTCKDNAQAREIARENKRRAWDEMSEAMKPKPMPNYLTPSSQNIRCTTNRIGGTSYTNCN